MVQSAPIGTNPIVYFFCSFLFRGGDSEAIEQMFSNVLYSVARTLRKYSANREENKINSFVFYPMCRQY